MTPLASSADLATLAERAGRAGRLGIDTEFMSEGRYRPLLCLVQVVAPDGESGDIALADPLVADAPDFAPLARALADPSVEVVVHAGRQDVAILRREWDTEVTALFDTQVAAGFAGFAAQAGYGSLLSGALRLTVPKTASYTRWDARPLTEEQLSYARGDVEHLLQLRDELARRLTRAGRLDWALEECRALAVSSDVRDPLECWRRLPKVTSLSARQRAVARELAAWRERTAEEQDKPVGSIVQDAALVEIARRQPRDPGALGDIRGVHQGIVRRRGKEIAAAVERGRVAEPIPGERGQGRGDPRDAPLVSLSDAFVRTRALDSGLASELVATRADLARIVAAVRLREPEPDVRTLRGWRRELAGEDLLGLLRGRRALSVGEGGTVVDAPTG
ncbi:MAG: ribonuclease D [Solirubrobacteraceae bacterium]